MNERWSVNDTGVKEGVVAFIAANTKGSRKQIYGYLANETAGS